MSSPELPDQGGTSPDAATLSFDDDAPPETALATPPSCARCNGGLDGQYWVSEGNTLCAACAEQARHSASARPGFRGLLKALALGCIAMMLGWGIYYVVSLTGYEFGLIAILVGLMVGVAVRAGSGGQGGRLYQVIAVVFTYVAITGSSTPYIVEGMLKGEREEAAKASASSAQSAKGQVAEGDADVPAGPGVSAASNTSTGSTAKPPNAAAENAGNAAVLVVRYVLAFGISLMMPFLMGFENVFGILILGIGLWEAWKINTRKDLVVEGPFALGSALSPSA